jgi:ABC-2 type transport system ATP-binding protein
VGPAVAVEGLTKRYGGRTVVDGVTFDVPAGSVLCLLGRNGAGKTTTVECVEGFRSPDAGSIRVLGHDPRSDRDRVVGHMGVMLQEGGAYQAATPREMLQLYRGLYPRARPVDEVLSVVALTERADDRFRSLSGGEKQRLNLALALIGRPDVYFLDEPTAGMDPAARRGTWDVITNLRTQGAAVVLTTHFIEEADHLADRVAVIHRGRLVADDTPSALRGTGQGLVVTTPATFDHGQLAAHLRADVVAAGADRYLVSAGPDRIADVSSWFAAAGLELTGVAVARPTLEEAFLALTGSDDGDTR